MRICQWWAEIPTFCHGPTRRLSSPYTPEYDTKEIPICDAAVLYECPYSGKVYIFVIRNALYVPAMANNLIPPFIMREKGIRVNETPKIQSDEPEVSDHAIEFAETGLRIPLKLWGTFSYFPTRKPTIEELQMSEEIYMLTPSHFNPHNNSYASNEDGMLDWQGNMADKSDRPKLMLSEIEDDPAYANELTISSFEGTAVSRNMDKYHDDSGMEKEHSSYADVCPLLDGDQVSTTLAGISPVLVDRILYERLIRRLEYGNFQMSIGSTHVGIVEDQLPFFKQWQDEGTIDTMYQDNNNDDDRNMLSNDDLMNGLYEACVKGDVNLDDIMTSAAHARRSRGVDAKHLSKVWKIDMDSARRTLEVTSQNSTRTDDPKLSRNYGTNDRMLWCKRIDQLFFMDTFFSTKKAGKSSRGNTCCQLFVTDKGFVFVAPMKS